MLRFVFEDFEVLYYMYEVVIIIDLVLLRGAFQVTTAGGSGATGATGKLLRHCGCR